MKNLFKVSFAVAAIVFATSCSSSKTEEAPAADSTAVVAADTVAAEAAPATDSTAAAEAAPAAEGEAKAEEHK